MVAFTLLEAIGDAFAQAYKKVSEFFSSVTSWFGEAFNQVVNFVNSIYDKIVTYIDDFAEYLFSFFETFYEFTLLVFKQIFFYIADYVAEMFLPYINQLLDQYPSIQANISDFNNYICYVNYFIDLEYCFTLFTAFSNFSFIYLGIRFMLKLVPLPIG